MTKEKKYIYSGIKPGKQGTGSFLEFFLKKADDNKIEYEFIAYSAPNIGTIKKIVRKISPPLYNKLVFFFYKTVGVLEKKQNELINDSTIFLFHPQTLGLKKSSNLINRNEKTYLYVLDNFFFCKKSYNYLSDNIPCLECINNRASHKKNNCNFFPLEQNQNDYDIFLDTIQDNLNKIHFLVQNKNQLKLLKKKFGDQIAFTILGMLIDFSPPIKTLVSKEYDFLYHNTLLEPKGIHFFLSIAKKMKDRSFVIPYSKEKVIELVGNIYDYKNINFIPTTWSSGLYDILIKTKIVFNTSTWSAPVEGALLKSIKFNGKVAVLDTNYSFQSEFSKDTLIKLNTSICDSVEILDEKLNNPVALGQFKKKSQDWFNKYYRESNLSFDSFFKNLG